VTVFLTSAAVDLARRRGIDMTQVPPLDPLSALVKDFLKRGGRLVACTPCVKSRGYSQEDLIEGTEIAGSSVIHEQLLAGAASLSF
jgi:predicted peroxiredoxin